MGDNYQSGVPIKSDTDYLFFLPYDNSFPGNSVDEPRLLRLKTTRIVDLNKLTNNSLTSFYLNAFHQVYSCLVQLKDSWVVVLAIFCIVLLLLYNHPLLLMFYLDYKLLLRI